MLAYGSRPGVSQMPTEAEAYLNRFVIDSYDNLSGDTSIEGQAHHLNQNAAYRDVIPSGQGISIKLRGNAFTEPGSEHYEAHAGLEPFWEEYRPAGSVPPPSNLEYTKALADSLRASGKSEAEVRLAVSAAILQRVEYGALGGMPVPRVPRRIYQTAPSN